jgi:hypothetical protein
MRLNAWVLVGFCLYLSSANAVTLYDASQNNFPEDQSWLFYAADASIGSKTAAGGHTSFDSGAQATRAGWSNYIPIINAPKNPSFPTLDRSTGFDLSFDLKVNSESHATNDRAGFDVILLGSDHQGVELGFWTDTIFAQTLSGTNFVHGEDHSFNTTSTTHYDLGIQGNTYQLYGNGSLLLTGNTRDYNSALSVPYGLNNYIFLGDDTTSATAAIELGNVSLVPEPASIAMLSGLLALSLASRRGRARGRSCPAAL